MEGGGIIRKEDKITGLDDYSKDYLRSSRSVAGLYIRNKEEDTWYGISR